LQAQEKDALIFTNLAVILNPFQSLVKDLVPITDHGANQSGIREKETKLE
jgi:hypothetical protein